MNTRETNYANIVSLWQRCESNSENTKEILYFCIGHEELTTTGLKHRHLYIETSTKLSGERWQRGKELLGVPDAHFESAKGTREQAVNYCFKENPQLRNFVYERQVDEPLPKRLKNIEELHLFHSVKDAFHNGSTDLKQYISLFPNQAEKCLALRKATPLAQKFKWHESVFTWQQKLCDFLLETPQERRIFWIESTRWSDGKSYCANLILAFREGQKLPTDNFTMHHLAGIIKDEAKVLIFDLPKERRSRDYLKISSESNKIKNNRRGRKFTYT